MEDREEIERYWELSRSLLSKIADIPDFAEAVTPEIIAGSLSGRLVRLPKLVKHGRHRFDSAEFRIFFSQMFRLALYSASQENDEAQFITAEALSYIVTGWPASIQIEEAITAYAEDNILRTPQAEEKSAFFRNPANQKRVKKMWDAIRCNHEREVMA